MDLVCNVKGKSQYKQRSPHSSQYYRCVNENFEELERVWSENFQDKYGFLRSHIFDVIYQFLDCEDLHLGFAKVKCQDCKEEYLLPFSCKMRHFCPSCHQRRVIEFGEFLAEEVLMDVPHSQWVFSIPKRLRIYFMFDRKLLAKLSKCAWKVLSRYLKESVGDKSSLPGAVISIQTFGDFLNFNSHAHLIATYGCFKKDGTFIKAEQLDGKDVEKAFQSEVLKMLKKEGKITDAVEENMKSWENTGFNVYCGSKVYPDDKDAMEKLARYIVRCPISQERMIYIAKDSSADGISKVVYKAKSGSRKETFSGLEWLARLITHIPNKGEQLVRYYGFYSNKSRGQRKNKDIEKNTPAIVNSEVKSKAFKKSWARLIKKIYGVDPLVCPSCGGKMKITSFVEKEDEIKQTLSKLGFWMQANHDPPKKSHTKKSSDKQLNEDYSENDFQENTWGDSYFKDSSPNYDEADPLPLYDKWY